MYCNGGTRRDLFLRSELRKLSSHCWCGLVFRRHSPKGRCLGCKCCLPVRPGFCCVIKCWQYIGVNKNLLIDRNDSRLPEPSEWFFGDIAIEGISFWDLQWTSYRRRLFPWGWWLANRSPSLLFLRRLFSIYSWVLDGIVWLLLSAVLVSCSLFKTRTTLSAKQGLVTLLLLTDIS